MTSTTFEPHSSISRAMIVTILYRISGSSMKRAPVGFTDVSSSGYYYYAVGWAQYYGIVQGVTSTTFEPNTSVTREQFITFLYRFVTSYYGYSPNLISESYVNDLEDGSKVGQFAKTAVNWGLNCGIIPSTTTNFGPQINMIRGVCANYIFKMMTRVLGKAKAFSMRELTEGRTSEIAAEMQSMGYKTCYGYDLTVREMQYAFYNSQILFTHSHGNTSFIKLMDGSFYGYQIPQGSMSNMKLIYVSACYSGQSFITSVYNVGGAKTAIAFTDKTYASTDTNGIHVFHATFFKLLADGYSVEKAIEMADTIADEAYTGKDTGADCIVVYGASNWK